MANKETRALSFAVDPQSLAEKLGLPLGVKIVGIEWSFMRRQAIVYVENHEFPVVPQGRMVPLVTPIITQKTPDDFIIWDWNLASAEQHRG